MVSGNSESVSAVGVPTIFGVSAVSETAPPTPTTTTTTTTTLAPVVQIFSSGSVGESFSSSSVSESSSVTPQKRPVTINAECYLGDPNQLPAQTDYAYNSPDSYSDPKTILQLVNPSTDPKADLILARNQCNDAWFLQQRKTYCDFYKAYPQYVNPNYAGGIVLWNVNSNGTVQELCPTCDFRDVRGTCIAPAAPTTTTTIKKCTNGSYLFTGGLNGSLYQRLLVSGYSDASAKAMALQNPNGMCIALNTSTTTTAEATCGGSGNPCQSSSHFIDTSGGGGGDGGGSGTGDDSSEDDGWWDDEDGEAAPADYGYGPAITFEETTTINVVTSTGPACSCNGATSGAVMCNDGVNFYMLTCLSNGTPDSRNNALSTQKCGTNDPCCNSSQYTSANVNNCLGKLGF